MTTAFLPLPAPAIIASIPVGRTMDLLRTLGYEVGDELQVP
jgi:hypothetical protein